MGKIAKTGLGVVTGGLVGGPVGSAVGGLIGSGGSVGGLGGSLKDMTGSARFSATESPLRANLDRALGVLQQRVDGDRPSVAELQMQQGLDQNLSDYASAVRSSPGMAPALQARLIGSAQMEQGTDLARAQAILRAGEQAQAEQTMLSGIGQGLQADMGMQQLNQAAFEGAQGRRGSLFGNIARGAGSILGMGGS